MKILGALSRLLSWLESGVVVVLLTLMIGLAFAQVILRNFFGTGLLWADPFLRHMVLWVGFLGASLATRGEKHINLDIVTRFSSPGVTNVVRIFTNLFAALVTGLLAKAGWTFLTNEASDEILFSIGQTGFLTRWFQVIIPVGFGLMAFRFFLRMLEHLGRAVRHGGPEAEEGALPETNVPTLES